jgi:ubiquinone/menaquinone biosynthesis C-methylase UbiE
MAMEAAMALTTQLLAQAQALGAVTAYMQMAADGRSADAALKQRIEDVVDVLGARDALDDLTPQERAVVVAFARSYMHQAVELMDEPTRPNAWSHSDPTILQAQGSASAVVATLIAQCGIGGPGMRVLDVGTGVAGLAIAFCRAFPDATVVGIDPWEPALSLARANVAREGLEARITLHALPIEAFSDDDGFDVVWLPSFFIPDAVIDDALHRVRDFLRPDGCLVAGVVEGPADPLAGAVDALITVRSGGAVLEPEQMIARMRSAGYDHVRELDRTWQAPLRLVGGHRPKPGRDAERIAIEA